MSKIFLTDIDEVLLDWFHGFAAFVGRNYPQYELDITQYSLGLPSNAGKQLVDEYNVSPEFANIPALRDAAEYVKKIKELGYTFVGITTCLGTKDTEVMRIKNLVDVFGLDTFSDLHCLHIGTSKLPALQKYEPTFWVDDKMKHCESAVKAGHKAFQMLHPYNEKDERPDYVTPVKSWKEIYEYILSSSSN